VSARNFTSMPEQPRLRDLVPGTTERARAAEGRASALLRQVGEPVIPSAIALEHLERSLMARGQLRGQRAGASCWWLRRSWVVGLALLASSAATATWLAVRRELSTPVRTSISPSDSRAVLPARALPASEAPPSLPSKPPTIAPPEHLAPHAPRAIAHHLPGSGGHAEAETPSPLLAIAASRDAEAALVAQALHELREEKNPRAALETLDEHTKRFPRGRLLHEAAVVRLEALTASGQREQALAALDGGLPALAPLGRSALILRGELRAAANRLEAARDDFEAAWAFRGKDDLAARALLGLARVELSLGARALAERNLHEYLDVFPHAPGAPDARKALGLP
jgi:hypothetical protein